ncbi:3-hydroxyacyl-ACP dehydratase FabZ [uncultured Peptoniphilus sp.]|uniref:3-hydroxyacyl-ACP dehydratase FabZ n=1 Tax=uncultured Peptoniphilus sp. TaxID=254354 RepID=UPI002804AACF|nr:3-hydroxyacyl-ACP dehydratase FabZ [uncultured Peptoniphilus sp.]
MEYGINEILKILPHKYPFLMVDKIIDGEEGKWALGIKNLTINEEFFHGHFQGRPIMPAVLILEAMAQTGAIAILAKEPKKLAVFTSLKNAKFKKMLVPGDRLEIKTEMIDKKLNVGFAKSQVKVDGKLAAAAEFSFAIIDK